MNQFFKGVLVLAVAACLGESIEFLTNMVLARELGEAGMGLYMSILPTIFLIVVIASLELPISIAKFVAERDKKEHRSMLEHATQLAIFSTAILMLVCLVAFQFIPVFDKFHPIVKYLIIGLIPLIAFSSIARGYFIGSNRMTKIAVSNFLRKIVQLLLLVFLYQMFDFQIEKAILIAVGTVIGSEVVVFVYLIHMYIVQMQYIRKQPMHVLKRKAALKSLMAVSLPTTALRLFHAFTSAVQPFLITYTLGRSGISASMAMEEFGLLAGVAFSIGFFPAFIAHSLLVVLIPTVSESYSKKDYGHLQTVLRHVVNITLIYGIPVTILFYFFADELTGLFFESTAATLYVQLLWPYFLFHFFIIPMQAYLIGLGLVKDALIHSVWATAVSYATIYFLGSNPHLQMQGVIIGMNVAAVLQMLLHYLTICKKIEVDIWARSPLKN